MDTEIMKKAFKNDKNHTERRKVKSKPEQTEGLKLISLDATRGNLHYSKKAHVNQNF